MSEDFEGSQRIRPFELRKYLSKYEFKAKYLLCCSDVESLTMAEVLSMASPEDKALWDNLKLSYVPDVGLPELREVIARELYPELSADNILCLAGAEEGIFCTFYKMCTPKDHVIVITPCFQPLAEIPKHLGSDVTEISLREENEWKLDLGEIEGAIQANTKILVINSPHNPTGRVTTQEELDKVIALCEKHGIWLFSDEVYRLLGSPSTPWAKSAASCYDRALSLGVMSKAFGMPGLRIGWIACKDTKLLDEIRLMRLYTTISNSAPSEVLSLIAMKNQSQIVERNNAIISNNLSLLDTFFKDYSSLLSWVRPEGACIGFVRYKGGENVSSLCNTLVEQKGVLLMPGEIYGDEYSQYFRIGFGRKNMSEALNELKAFLEEGVKLDQVHQR